MTPAMLPLLERYLQLTSDREQTIVANMANVDTPGYHTQDIDFQGELKRAANEEGSGDLHPVAHAVQGLIERPDGNNVNIDRESLELSEMQLQYQMGVQLVKSHFHQLLSAINEGK